MTFAHSPTTTTSADVYFGCGTKQTGNIFFPDAALDGLLGFGWAGISVPTQSADQGRVGKMFAHCLQGDTVGGGNIVIGNITEPGITYTPTVPGRTLYNVGMQNIGVNGVNITSPQYFTITATTYGVILDSGATMAYLIEPAYTQFVASGTSAWCMAWSASSDHSSFGDVVLKDQLIVYDNYNQLIG